MQKKLIGTENITILIDSREKDLRVQKQFEEMGYPFLKRKLHYGDYSFITPQFNFEHDIVIERKGTIDEVTGNFTHGRERFRREFRRSRGKVVLMIEASEDEIYKGGYRSRMPPAKLISYLQTWAYKFGLRLKFVEKENAALEMLKEFKKFI